MQIEQATLCTLGWPAAPHLAPAKKPVTFAHHMAAEAAQSSINTRRPALGLLLLIPALAGRLGLGSSPGIADSCSSASSGVISLCVMQVRGNTTPLAVYSGSRAPVCQQCSALAAPDVL